ncbi:hypothetical protein JCM10213v2_002756 [Rhodosporidiobolus nylandii]
MYVVSSPFLCDNPTPSSRTRAGDYTLWPALFTSVGDLPSQDTGWEAKAGSSITFEVNQGWGGRIWGRTNCDFTSDKPDYQIGLKCNTTAGTGVGPCTLAEFNLQTDVDNYDTSNVDGFNLPLAITNTDGCSLSNCPYNLLEDCPTDLQKKNDAGDVVGCLTDCGAHGDNDTPDKVHSPCPSSNIPNYSWWKNQCPIAYAYAYDESSGTALFTCTGGTANYQITFCPGPEYYSTTALLPNGSTITQGADFSTVPAGTATGGGLVSAGNVAGTGGSGGGTTAAGATTTEKGATSSAGGTGTASKTATGSESTVTGSTSSGSSSGSNGSSSGASSSAGSSSGSSAADSSSESSSTFLGMSTPMGYYVAGGIVLVAVLAIGFFFYTQKKGSKHHHHRTDSSSEDSQSTGGSSETSADSNDSGSETKKRHKRRRSSNSSDDDGDYSLSKLSAMGLAGRQAARLAMYAAAARDPRGLEGVLQKQKRRPVGELGSERDGRTAGEEEPLRVFELPKRLGDPASWDGRRRSWTSEDEVRGRIEL